MMAAKKNPMMVCTIAIAMASEHLATHASTHKDLFVVVDEYNNNNVGLYLDI